MTTLFLTAAVGGDKFLAAANRLLSEARNLEVFTSCQIARDSDIDLLSHYLGVNYSKKKHLMNPKLLFSNYGWKPTVAYLGFLGRWGRFDSIFYLDAGCEICPSIFSRYRIDKLIQESNKKGAVFFSSQSSEIQHNSGKLLDFFELDSNCFDSHQIQAGTWVMSQEVGLDISKKWFDFYTIEEKLLFEVANQDHNFRHDQSVLSLIVKSYKKFDFSSQFAGPRRNFLSDLKGFFMPFRVARNRYSSSSTFHPFLLRLGAITLVLRSKVLRLFRIP